MKKEGQIITVTSGKGGVGKTTSSANIAYSIAKNCPDKKVAVMDFDVGTRNLDLILGMERKVVYTFVDYLIGKKDKMLNVAVKDKRNNGNLFLISTSQTEDKDILDKYKDKIPEMIKELRENFDYIIIDSPAGIEAGAMYAMMYCDKAIVVCNPEVSSLRDADRMMGLIQSKHSSSSTKTDVSEEVPVDILITRFREGEDVMSVADICEVLSHNEEPIGIIPEDPKILESTNRGVSVVDIEDAIAGFAYVDTAKRIVGEEVPLKIHAYEKKGFFSRLFK